jgi:hypothetical protein
MIKRSIILSAFILCSSQAMAVCPTPLTGKDAAGTTQNFGVTVDGSGNCYGNVGIVDGTNAANKAAVKAASTAAAQTDPAVVERNPDIGTIGDTAWTSGSGSVIAVLKGIYTGIQSLISAVGSAIAAGTNMIGYVGLQANTTGGCTAGHVLTAASNNSTSITNRASGAAELCELSFLNTTTGVFDIRLYDVAAAPTCSSATGVVANYIAVSSATSPGFSINLGPFGKAFTNGIGVCITGANADNDNTNAATGGNLNYAYK